MKSFSDNLDAISVAKLFAYSDDLLVPTIDIQSRFKILVLPKTNIFLGQSFSFFSSCGKAESSIEMIA